MDFSDFNLEGNESDFLDGERSSKPSLLLFHSISYQIANRIKCYIFERKMSRQCGNNRPVIEHFIKPVLCRG